MNFTRFSLHRTFPDLRYSYVTEPAKVDHVNSNYTELYFRNTYLPFRMQYTISISYRGKPIKLCSIDEGIFVVVEIAI